MVCPYCKQPIVAPVWECHAEQDFCSVECGMRFVHGEPVPRPIESLRVLLGAKFEFAYKADDFAEEYFIGPFIVSNDVLNDWFLFFNHKEYGYIYIADLNRLASIMRLILNGDIQTAASFLSADILDRVGVVVSRGHWTIGPVHIYGEDTDGWSWRIKTDAQQTRTG